MWLAKLVSKILHVLLLHVTVCNADIEAEIWSLDPEHSWYFEFFHDMGGGDQQLNSWIKTQKVCGKKTTVRTKEHRRALAHRRATMK